MKSDIEGQWDQAIPAERGLPQIGTQKVVAHAEARKPEGPWPLCREVEPAEPFPVDALGDVLGSTARAIEEKTQTPLAICGQSVLAFASLAAQGYRDVQLPTGSTSPLSCYFASVAESGDRKSAADERAEWPVRKHEQNLQDRFDIDQSVFKNDLDAYEKSRSAILGAAKDASRASVRADLEALGKPPVVPLTPILTAPEPTYEGLVRLLKDGQPSVGVFSDEGGQFIGGHAMNADNRLKTAAAMSGLWDGRAIRRIRQGDGAYILRGRRVSMHLMVQPGVADELFSDPKLADQGLLSRFLIVAPNSRAGTRFWREPSEGCDTAINRYGARILDLLERPLPTVEEKPNELEPPVVPLSPEARSMWIKFSDSIEAQIGEGGSLAPIRGLANKLPEHATRVAGVLSLVDNPECPEVSDSYLACGIELAQHYAGEALRLFGSGKINADIALAGKLLRWIRQTWKSPLVSLPDIYQRGLNAIPDQKTALRIVRTLEDHGWLVRVEGGAFVRDTFRRDVWSVVDK